MLNLVKNLIKSAANESLLENCSPLVNTRTVSGRSPLAGGEQPNALSKSASPQYGEYPHELWAIPQLSGCRSD